MKHQLDECTVDVTWGRRGGMKLLRVAAFKGPR